MTLSCGKRTEPASPTCCRCPGRNSMKTPCESKSVQSKPIKAPPPQCDFHMTLSCGKRTEPASPTCCRCPGRNSMKTPCESKSVQSKPIKAPPPQCDFPTTALLSCEERTEPEAASPTCCRCPGRKFNENIKSAIMCTQLKNEDSIYPDKLCDQTVLGQL